MTSNQFDFESPRCGISIADPQNEEHCRVYLDLFNQPSFIKNLDGITSTQSIDTMRTFLERRWTEMYERWGYGNYIVYLKPSADPLLPEPFPVGIISMVREPDAPAPDLGYAFLDAYQGHGYATEACRAMIEHTRKTANEEVFLVFTKDWNRSSRALVERMGFKLMAMHDYAALRICCYMLGADNLDWDWQQLIHDRFSKMPLERREAMMAGTAVSEAASIPEKPIAAS